MAGMDGMDDCRAGGFSNDGSSRVGGFSGDVVGEDYPAAGIAIGLDPFRGVQGGEKTTPHSDQRPQEASPESAVESFRDRRNPHRRSFAASAPIWGAGCPTDYPSLYPIGPSAGHR